MACQAYVVLTKSAQTIALYKRVRGTHCSGKPKLQVVPLDSEYPKDGKTKVLCWVETPLNPTGEIIDIAHCESGLTSGKLEKPS